MSNVLLLFSYLKFQMPLNNRHVLHYLQYFTEDSGGLWKKHCEREFRGSVPDEMESWREMYLVSF